MQLGLRRLVDVIDDIDNTNASTRHVVVIVNCYMLIYTSSAALGTDGGSVACCLHLAKNTEQERFLLLKRLKNSEPKFLKFGCNLS